MSVYSLSPIFQPQFVANAAAALVFATPGAPVAVPAGYRYQISVLRVTNVTAAPVALTVFRVKSGATAVAGTTVVPVTVLVPVASNTFPHFEVTSLWGAVLAVGDAIWATAGSASALVIQGDGAIVEG